MIPKGSTWVVGLGLRKPVTAGFPRPRDTQSKLLGLVLVDQSEEGWRYKQPMKLQDCSYFGHDPLNWSSLLVVGNWNCRLDEPHIVFFQFRTPSRYSAIFAINVCSDYSSIAFHVVFLWFNRKVGGGKGKLGSHISLIYYWYVEPRCWYCNPLQMEKLLDKKENTRVIV